MRIRRIAPALGMGALLCLTACSETIVEAGDDWAIRVSLTKVGVGFGPILVQVDAGIPQSFSLTRTIPVRRGRHTVTLAAVPTNCTVTGENPRTVEVTGPLTEVNFEVTCVAVRGSLAIGIALVGVDGPAEYAVSVDDGAPLAVREAAWIQASVGSHSIRLLALPSNCVVSGENPRTVSIPAGALSPPIVTVDLGVSCTAVTAIVEISAATLGGDLPAYLGLLVDGVASASQVAPNGTTQLILPVGEHTLRLAPLATNCAVSGESSHTVTLPGGGFSRATVAIGFTLECVRTERIAFTRWNQGPEIVVANTDGSDAVAIAQGAMAPSWAPDGTRLVFEERPCSPTSCSFGGLAVINADGTGRRSLTHERDHSPSWSPDGSTIVFSRVTFSGSHSREELYLIGADGSGERALPVPFGVRYMNSPSWSPDGRSILFNCGAVGSWYSDICKVGVDGTGFAWLTNDEWGDWSPKWSPNGSRIAFSTTRYDTDPNDVDEYGYPLIESHIALLDPASGAVADLSIGWNPAWSRDGTKLVFEGGGGLYLIYADGSGRTRIVEGWGMSLPVWRP